MATFYLDFEGGNNSNAGTSFALRWLSITAGATAARIAPGDEIRIMASPDPTLVGNATWTNNSRTITLAGAVTMNIDTCEVGWTAAANVTATAAASPMREGTNSCTLTPAGGFTTGRMAHRATGTLDLSAYQQVSFMWRTSASANSGDYTLRLCSDTGGVTAVHTLTIPASGATMWQPVVINTGANLNSAIASVAIYAAVDPGTRVCSIDNIIACKATSSADSLTHESLIGKVWNLSWVASTSYSIGDKRRPTQANRNGFLYECIDAGTSHSSEPTWPTDVGLTVVDGGCEWECCGLEDTWYPIASINGTTVMIDGDPGTAATSGLRAYHGDTETVATYKREPITVVGLMQIVGTASTANVIQEAGTPNLNTIYSGGWNRTDMSTQTGETWVNGRTGYGAFISAAARNHITYRNLNSVRFAYSLALTSTSLNVKFENCHALAHGTGGFANAGGRFEFHNLVSAHCASGITGLGGTSYLGTAMQIVGVSNSSNPCLNFGPGYCEVNYLTFKNNNNSASTGFVGVNSSSGAFARLKNVATAGNASPPVPVGGGGFDFISSTFAEATHFTAPTAGYDAWITSTRHQATNDNHLLTSDGCTIASATDQRNTASGISWKFLLTSTSRAENYPVRLTIAKVKCTSGVARTMTIYTRRDSTNIKGKLIVRGGQLPGVTTTSVACEPSINTWTQSGNLVITSSEDGVVEVEMFVWDGIGTTNAYWVDDFEVT